MQTGQGDYRHYERGEGRGERRGEGRGERRGEGRGEEKGGRKGGSATTVCPEACSAPSLTSPARPSAPSPVRVHCCVRGPPPAGGA